MAVLLIAMNYTPVAADESYFFRAAMTWVRKALKCSVALHVDAATCIQYDAVLSKAAATATGISLLLCMFKCAPKGQ